MTRGFVLFVRGIFFLLHGIFVGALVYAGSVLAARPGDLFKALGAAIFLAAAMSGWRLYKRGTAFYALMRPETPVTWKEAVPEVIRLVALVSFALTARAFFPAVQPALRWARENRDGAKAVLQGKFPGMAVSTALVQGMRHQDPEVRALSARAAGMMGLPGDKDLACGLAALAQDPNEKVRAAQAKAVEILKVEPGVWQAMTAGCKN